MIKKRTQHNSVWDMVAESLEDLSKVKDVTASMREFNDLAGKGDSALLKVVRDQWSGDS